LLDYLTIVLKAEKYTVLGAFRILATWFFTPVCGFGRSLIVYHIKPVSPAPMSPGLLDLLQKSFSSIDGTGSSAHPTRVIFFVGWAEEPVQFIFARGLI